MNNGVKGNGSDNKFFTMEFFGVTLIISSFLLAVCLLFGNSVIYLIGGEVQSFLLGVFGYFAYPLLLILNYLGFMAFFGKKTINKNAVKPLLTVSLFLISFLSFLNVLTTSTTASTYSEYLTNAYESGKNGLSGVCAGGLVISLITYPFVKYLTKLGAIITFIIITLLIVYLAIKFRSSLYVKISGVRDYPVNSNGQFNPNGESDSKSNENGKNFVEVNVPNGSVEPNGFANNQPPYNPNQNYNGYNGNNYIGNYNGYNNFNGYNNGNYNGYNNGANQFGNSQNQYNVDRENAMRILYGTPPTYSQSYNNSFYSEQSHYPPNVNQVKPSVDDNMISNPIKKEFKPPEFTEVDNSYNSEVTSSKIFDDSISYNDEFSDDALDVPQNVSSYFDSQNNDNYSQNDDSNALNDESVNEEENVVESVDNSSKRLIENMPLNYKYNAPPISLFKTIDNTQNNYEIEVFKAEVKERILSTLERFGVKTNIARVYRGPAVTRFDIEIPPDVPLSKVTSRQNDLNLRIAAKSAIRMIAPIPNTSYVGIEVPNSTMDSVSIKDIISSEDFLNSKPFSLTFALGKDVIGKPVSLDIADMPHLLVTGTTGSGKSVCLNSLIISLMVKYGPDELRFVIVDPKRVDLEPFKDVPHMMFDEIIEDVPTTNAMLTWAVEEMENRYRELAKMRAKNIKDYNTKARANGTKIMPRIVIIIDEFADIMLQDKKGVGVKVCAIAQKARAAGIHLVLAAQRPSVDIIEGPIKSNLPSRIVFKASSQYDSMTSLGEIGAEKLLGRGDCLYKTNGMYAVERVMGAYVSDEEMYDVIDYVSNNNEKYFDHNNWAKIKASVSSSESASSDRQGDAQASGGSSPSGDNLANDPLYVKAIKTGYDYGGLSVSLLQRKLGVGYPRAAKIIDWLTDNGYITPNVIDKKHQMIMPLEEFEEKFGGES